MTSFPKQTLEDDDHPIMVIEQRPSAFTGHSWWLVLSYKTAQFEDMLPFEFPSFSEAEQALAIALVAERLRQAMAAVLVAEDNAIQESK